MKKLFVSLLFVLLMTSAALAVISPHTPTLGCTACHVNPSNYLLGITGVNNLCLTCHNPSLMTEGFLPGDIANPFNSTNLGLYASGMKHTSHNWAAPVNVPAAGAATPVNSAMSALYATQDGMISCASCHDQHASSATDHFLFRFPNDSDQLCFDCHRARNQINVQSGTHPVNFNYTSATSKVKLDPREYQPVPVNANPANPTSAMQLPKGKLICTTCHGVHFTDSNAITFDNASSSAFGQLSSSQGYLLRTYLRGGTANAVNICTNCHAGKLAHNRNGQNVQCADCHAGHVDPGDGSRPNVWLVRRYMNYSTGVMLNSFRRPVFDQYTASQSNFAGVDGVCQACHIIPPPGGSYPPEHASKDPNVCRTCHVHNNTAGSFSADCTSCHGFPPQQNTAGGPLGYARTASYNYANSPAFKDESKTPHMAHAGKAPYAFSCYECHGGDNHDNGNFQQVFISTNGTIAASSGAVPSYNTANPGTCSNVYCHSNGAPAGLTTIYKSPTWATAKGSIVGTPGECGACHDAMPATNAHTGHIITNGFACSICHAATVSGNTSIIDTSKHVNGIKDVLFSGAAAIGGSGSYNGTAHTCSNIYCHSNGNQGAFVYVNPAAWTSGVKYGCNGCHGTSSPIGAPDYPNGGVGTTTANTHAAHVAGAMDTTVCANCHFSTASFTTGGALAANSKHLNGSVDVVFNPATAGPNATWNPATGTCTNIACHGGAPAQWGSTAACLTCHSFAISGRAAIGPQFSANSHHSQGGTVTAAQCYQCHWEANSNGSINLTYHHANIPGGPVELVVYGAGVRPTTYTVGTTATPYTANGTRTEIAKINTHCIGCHSDQNNATTPFGDGKTPKTYAWDGSSIATKYGSKVTTPWGKYAGANTTPKNTVTKALSAHLSPVNAFLRLRVNWRSQSGQEQECQESSLHSILLWLKWTSCAALDALRSRSGASLNVDSSLPMRVRLALDLPRLTPLAYFNEQPLAMSQNRFFRVQNRSFCPVLAAFVPGHPRLQPDRRLRWHRPQIIHLHVARHGHNAVRTYRLAHGLVQQRGDDAAVEQPVRPFKHVAYLRQRNHLPVIGQKELEMQPDRVGFAAAKTAVLRGMRQGSQVFDFVLSSSCASNIRPQDLPVKVAVHVCARQHDANALSRFCCSVIAPASAAAPAPSARLCVSS